MDCTCADEMLMRMKTLPSRRKTSCDEETGETGSVTDVDSASVSSCDYGTFTHVSKASRNVTQRPKGKPTYASILTPQVVGLLVSTVGLVIASETIFSLYVGFE